MWYPTVNSHAVIDRSCRIVLKFVTVKFLLLILKSCMFVFTKTQRSSRKFCPFHRVVHLIRRVFVWVMAVHHCQNHNNTSTHFRMIPGRDWYGYRVLESFCDFYNKRCNLESLRIRREFLSWKFPFWLVRAYCTVFMSLPNDTLRSEWREEVGESLKIVCRINKTNSVSSGRVR